MVEIAKKLLCVEDDRETAALIEEELADRGFDVVVVHEGHEGLVAVLKGIPDLVLCDVGLPNMSGFEILERRNDLSSRLKTIPFIFLTALSDRGSELRGRQLGADDYVIKPIDFDILESVINARLAGVARNQIWPTLIHLNDREAEILTWSARGRTSAEIGRVIGLSKRTVEFHLENARRKLGAGNRTEAVVKAALGGLIKP
jgi:DNA-binding response OmpR family regulator